MSLIFKRLFFLAMNKSYIPSRLKSFSYAWNGLIKLFKNEPNAQIHLLAAFVATIFGLFLRIRPVEWISLAMVIALVIMAELLNTSIEKLADAVMPKRNEKIGMAKDFAAGAVLIAAVLAVIVGAIIFIPKLYILIF